MTIEVPDSLAELFSDPQSVIDCIAMIKALREMSVILATPGNNNALTAATPSIKGDPPNLQLILPLRFASRISPASGGGTVDTQCRAQLAALLSALTSTGQNP